MQERSKRQRKASSSGSLVGRIRERERERVICILINFTFHMDKMIPLTHYHSRHSIKLYTPPFFSVPAPNISLIPGKQIKFYFSLTCTFQGFQIQILARNYSIFPLVIPTDNHLSLSLSLFLFSSNFLISYKSLAFFFFFFLTLVVQKHLCFHFNQ